MKQEKIAEFILKLRSNNNLTQKEFADIIGVTSQAVSKWENGRGIPDIEFLTKICLEFNVELDEIILGKNKKNNKFTFLYFFVGLAIVFLIFIIFMFLSKNDYNISPVTSDNDLFVIDGVAAYSEDKKSIHVTNLNVLSQTDELFVLYECGLYEKEGDITVKITGCDNSSLVSEFDLNVADTFEKLLEPVEFHKTNYTSICSDLENANLFINIKLINEKNNIIYYEIPLLFDYACVS